MRYIINCISCIRCVSYITVATNVTNCNLLYWFYFSYLYGWTLWKEKPQALDRYQSMPATKQIVFALSVSLLNPHASMDTIGVIGMNAAIYEGTDKMFFTITTIIVSWFWFIFLAIAGKVVGNIDKTGKYILILNKFSALIIVIVACIRLKHLLVILF